LSSEEGGWYMVNNKIFKKCKWKFIQLSGWVDETVDCAMRWNRVNRHFYIIALPGGNWWNRHQLECGLNQSVSRIRPTRCINTHTHAHAHTHTHWFESIRQKVQTATLRLAHCQTGPFPLHHGNKHFLFPVSSGGRGDNLRKSFCCDGANEKWSPRPPHTSAHTYHPRIAHMHFLTHIHTHAHAAAKSKELRDIIW
jgi:hypothetical protein